MTTIHEWVDVDGEAAHVTWTSEPTDEDREAFREVVRALRRRVKGDRIE